MEKLEDTGEGFFDFKMTDIKGDVVDFASFKGKYKAYIIVNVASTCGLTNTNYTQLVRFHDQFEARGLKIMGFPCNQFLNHEKKSEVDIEEFIKKKFRVKFQMFSKIEVNGPSCHPLYSFLRRNSELYDAKTGKCKEVQWNFVKFILNQDGKMVAYRPSFDRPETFRPLIEELVTTAILDKTCDPNFT